MEPGRPGRRVNILGRVVSGHGSVSNTHDPVFRPGFGATKMYILSTGALSLSACLAQAWAAQVGYQQYSLSCMQSDIDNNCTWHKATKGLGPGGPPGDVIRANQQQVGI